MDSLHSGHLSRVDGDLEWSEVPRAMPFVTASDVSTLQTSIHQELSDLDSAFTACQLQGNIPAGSAESDQWVNMKSRTLAFLATTPSTIDAAAQMDAGQQLQRDLGPWYDTIAANGCKVPSRPAQPPAPTDMFSSLKGLMMIWLVIEAMKTFRS